MIDDIFGQQVDTQDIQTEIVKQFKSSFAAALEDVKDAGLVHDDQPKNDCYKNDADGEKKLFGSTFKDPTEPYCEVEEAM